MDNGIKINGKYVDPLSAVHVFDMDGVLFRYCRPAFLDTGIWQKPGFFQYMQEDPYMLIYLRSISNGMDNIYVESRLPAGDIADRVKTEKRESLRRILPDLDESHIIFISDDGDKPHGFTDKTGIKLTENVILYDDQNINLSQWQDAGGTAVKYLNGVNSPASWTGNKFARYEIASCITEGMIKSEVIDPDKIFYALFPYDDMYAAIYAPSQKKAAELLTQWYRLQYMDAKLTDDLTGHDAYLDHPPDDIILPQIALTA